MTPTDTGATLIILLFLGGLVLWFGGRMLNHHDHQGHALSDLLAFCCWLLAGILAAIPYIPRTWNF